MTTLAELVDDSYGLLYGIAQAERPQEDTNAAELALSSDNLEMDTPDLWKRGDYAESPTGELIIFAENHPSSGTAVVRREQRSTNSTAPYTADSVFYRNPTFPRYEIEKLVRQVVRNDLWPHVWTWYKGTVSFDHADSTYDLPTYIEDVVSVYQYDLASDDRWYPLDRPRWDVERQIATAVATNGGLLRLRSVRDESETVYYTGKRRPDVSDLSNVSDEIAELIPWAVVGKLAAATRAVAKRHNPASDSNEQLEGAEFRDYRGFMSEFLRMRDQLNRQLVREVPSEPIFRPRRRRRAY